MDTTQLLKGVLDVAVLAVVEDEDGYGYDVLRRLRAGGLSEVGDASVYGTLRRLYAAGALTSYVVPSDEGPHRKYYGITPAGRAQLAGQTEDWERFAQTVSALLSDTRTVTRPSSTPEPQPENQHQGASA
ncbi:PadR family transcriptional regulator [Nocardioides anomalus]|uniref:PadR family transcriptional regulator n=1 Tax=Nocardioides anomalus TaxID=2712223 RepID=UPI0018AD4FC1|nr:PadR family transcriptional regulator [Nocardioides anomalus]